MTEQWRLKHSLVLALILLLAGVKALGYYQVTPRSVATLTIKPGIKRADIGTITVQNYSAIVKFTKLATNTWIIETSEGQRAYEVAAEPMNQLLSFLSSPYEVSPVESEVDDQRLILYGLNEDKRVTITVEPINGRGDPSILILGSYAQNGSDLYIHHGNSIYRAPLTNFYSMINAVNSWIGVEEDKNY